jgi:hypothetical protein
MEEDDDCNDEQKRDEVTHKAPCVLKKLHYGLQIQANGRLDIPNIRLLTA